FDHPAVLSLDGQPDARVELLFHDELHPGELRHHRRPLSADALDNDILGGRLLDARSDLRVPVRLHPGSQGTLPRGCASDDDVPAVRTTVSLLRHALYAAAQWPAWPAAGRAEHPGDRTALLVALCAVRDGRVYISLYGDEHRDGADQRGSAAGGGGNLPGRQPLAGVLAGAVSRPPPRPPCPAAPVLRP